MKYDWDIEQIAFLKQYYKKLRRQFHEYEEKQKINQGLQSTKDMESLMNPFKMTFVKPELYVDRNHFLQRSTLKSYFQIPKNIRSLLLETIPILKDFDPMKEYEELSYFSLTIKQLIKMTHDFFAWLPNKSYLPLVDYYLKPENHFLKFSKITFNPIMGCTFIFPFPYHQAYFYVERKKNLEDVYSLNHELAHGIYGINFRFPYTNELVGYFYEYLTTLFLKEQKGIDSSLLEIAEQQFTLNALNNFIILYYQNISISLYQKKKKIEIEDLVKHINQKNYSFFINEAILDESLNLNPQVLASYCYSYLLFLHYKKLAEQDLEKAFYTFEQDDFLKQVLDKAEYSKELEQEIIKHHLTL